MTLVLEPFTMENNLLTPTFKASSRLRKPVSRLKLLRKFNFDGFLLLLICFQVKRPQAKAYFEKEISNMYAELATSDPSPKKVLSSL